MGDMAKDFDLLKRIVAPTSDRQPLPVDISRLTKIIREEIPAALEKQAPPNFLELYFDFEQIYGQFHDFLLFDKLIGKNIVALGGSFSSGKSSFLNSILGKFILPAHLDPSTSVPTYVIYGSEESAWGINEFDVKLNLTFPDIKSIAHGFGNSDVDEEEEAVKSDVITLGHLLQSVFVSAPNLSYRNIAFLDTPGYSKPDSSSYSAKTDERIARAQLNSSNYILWFVPADAGVITADDVAFLDSLDKSIPKLIIITKADKAPNDGELEIMRGKVKSTLDVKGIRYEDVLLFSRRKGQEYDKEKILNYLSKLDGVKQEVDFARSFKKLFVECRKFYDETLKNEERKISRLNYSLTLEENDEVRECLNDMAQDVRDNIKELKEIRERLDTLKTELFSEIKSVADTVHIPMPEPSEIELLEGNINNPENTLNKILQKRHLKINDDLIIRQLKNLRVASKHEVILPTDTAPDVKILLDIASHSQLSNHELKSANDNYVKRAYLILLATIAQIDKQNSASLFHVCRIALKCNQKDNLNEYLKECLTLGEDDFEKYIAALSSKNIRIMFIIDALLMARLYDEYSEKRLSYVVGLSVILGLSKIEMEEIVSIVVAQIQDIRFFQGKFSALSFEKVVEYLQEIHSYKIETPRKAILYNVNMSGINQTMKFSNLDILEIKNCNFSNGNIELFEAKDTKLINMTGSHFENFSDNVFNAVNVDKVIIEGCKFNCCSVRSKKVKYKDDGSYQRYYKYDGAGAIGGLYNVNLLSLSNTFFKDCFAISRPCLLFDGKLGLLFSIANSWHEDIVVKNCNAFSSIMSPGEVTAKYN